MNNPVRDNVEMMLDEEIDAYLEKDPKGLYVTGNEVAMQFFSKEDIFELEELIERFEQSLLNLIFLTDEEDIVSLAVDLKQISNSVIAHKDFDKYMFVKKTEEGHVLFDVIDKNHYLYSEFDRELSRYFAKEENLGEAIKILKA